LPKLLIIKERQKSPVSGRSAEGRHTIKRGISFTNIAIITGGYFYFGAAYFNTTFLPVLAEILAASKMLTTIKLLAKEDKSFVGLISPFNIADR